MKIALLATGDELIIGDTLNTNSQQIAHILNSEGLDLGCHLACSDNEADIFHGLQFLSQEHDIIIVTGGLGPTSDDRTRFALSRFLSLPLIEFPAALEHIQKRLSYALNEGNKQQSKFPKEALLLDNPFGTAMGCYLTYADKLYILLPGPPRECMPMFTNFALPYLQTIERSSTQLLKWRLFGVAESEIAEQFDNGLKSIPCETGYRLETPYIECKVRVAPDLIPAVTQIIEPLIKPYIIATVEKKASEQLRDSLLKWKKNTTIIDEVTGGLLQTLLRTPATYSWLKFHDQGQSDFHFHLQGLDEFWTSQSAKKQTSFTIHFTHKNGEEIETHTIPYRSPLVVHYAAEWLSFRLFHLINQLHQ